MTSRQHTRRRQTPAERSLLRACERGDRNARARVAEENLPLVRSVARRYARSADQLDELVQVGCIGLIKAIDHFELDRGVDLQTYAAPTIDGELRHYLRDQVCVIRLPRAVRELRRRLMRLSDELGQHLGRVPSTAELAAAAGVDEAATAQALRAGVVVHLDPEEGSGPDAAAEDAHEEDRTALTAAFRTLDQVERRVVYRRFFEDLTQEEIGRELGISQAHVSRLLHRAIEKMRVELGT
jgi:RNA polymerase sigma-B factor